MKQKWDDIIADNENEGKWFALTDCEYVDDVLDTCVVVDQDSDLAALEERLAEKGIENCTIKSCGKSKETGENPRITRGTLVNKPK